MSAMQDTLASLQDKVATLEGALISINNRLGSVEGATLEGKLNPNRFTEEPDWLARPKVSEGQLVVFVHPICPFAHRAWICALEKKGIDGGVRFVQIDLKDKPVWYKDIYADQTVPALQYGPDFVLGDSTPCCEWMEKEFKGQGTQLIPSDPKEKSAMDAVLAAFGGKFVMPAYKLLKNQDPKLDAELCATLQQGIDWFEECLEGGKAPFFLGAFSMFEVLTAPFFSRFRHTLLYWRGFGYITDSKHARLTEWLQACEERPSIAHSLRPGAYYIKLYTSYAVTRRTAV